MSQFAWVYTYTPGTINSTPFYSQKHPSVEAKALYDNSYLALIQTLGSVVSSFITSNLTPSAALGSHCLCTSSVALATFYKWMTCE